MWFLKKLWISTFAGGKKFIYICTRGRCLIWGRNMRLVGRWTWVKKVSWIWVEKRGRLYWVISTSIPPWKEDWELHFPESTVSRHPIYILQWHTHLRTGRERGDTDHMFPPAVVGSHIGVGRCGVLQPPLVFSLWITCLPAMGSSSSQSSRIRSGFLW